MNVHRAILLLLFALLALPCQAADFRAGQVGGLLDLTLASCPECNVALVATQKKKSLSVAGLIGALLFVIGLITMFVNVVVGILLMILALIISVVGRGSKTIMVCPQCGKKGAAL